MTYETAISGLLALAAADPMEAVSRARRMLEQSPSPADRVTLLRTLGTALQLRGDPVRSMAAFEAAIEVAKGLGDRESAVAATISLAGALATVGRSDEALAALDALGAPIHLAGRVHFQRGSILARTGQSREAAEQFDIAESHLSAANDPGILARLYKNRGMVELALSHPDAARRDLERARRLFAEIGDTYEAGMTEHSLGLAATAGGSPAEALAWFDRSEPTIVNVAGAQLHPGRAEALLAAGLFDEAHREATKLAGRFKAAGMDDRLAEAHMLAAEAALLAGHPEDALRFASDSRTMFFAQNRPAWEARAMLVELAALEQADTIEHGLLDATIEDLASSGLRVAAARAEAIAARAAARAGRAVEARAHLQGARHLIGELPFDLEIDLRSAEVEVRIVSGDPAGAARMAASGLRSLANRRGVVAATDARAGLARHSAHLAQRGLELAIDSRQARRVWAWMEQQRVNAFGFRRVRSRDDAANAAPLAELRSITARIQHAEQNEETAMADRQRHLEKAIEARTRATEERPTITTSAVVDTALDRLGETALVEMAAVGGDLWAVFTQQRRVSLLRLGDRVEWEEAARALAAAMRRALYSPHDDERRSSFQSLVDGFAGTLRSVLPDHEGPMIVIPTAALAGVPWDAILRRHGPVVVSPSTALWLAAQPGTDGTGSVSSLAGPDLTNVADEVTRVGLIHERARIATNPTVAEASRLLETSDSVHIACTGRFRPGQPLFNSLTFGDGDLFVHDIEGLDALPTNIVLSVRETGFAQRTGREMLETAAALLASGVRSIVASPWPVPDVPTVTSAMVRLHRGLAAGLTPSSALHDAPRVGPESMVLDAFSCFGA